MTYSPNPNEIVLTSPSPQRALLCEKRSQQESRLEDLRKGKLQMRPTESQQLVMEVETLRYILSQSRHERHLVLTKNDTKEGVKRYLPLNHLPLGAFLPEAASFESIFDKAWDRAQMFAQLST